MSAKRRAGNNEEYIHGSAAHDIEPEFDELGELIEDTMMRRRAFQAQMRQSRTPAASQSAPSISLFAIIGFFAVASLMIFVMLAQVNLNEVMRETARLNTHLEMLGEQRRALSIAFESVIDMDEVERYARDVLGMSAPEAGQYTVIRVLPNDRVEVFDVAESGDWFREIGEFLTFLFDQYIR